MWGWWILNREIESMAKFGAAVDHFDECVGEMCAGSRILDVKIVVVIAKKIVARHFGRNESWGDFIAVDDQLH